MSWLKKISLVFLLVTLSAMPVTEAFAGLNPFTGLTNALTSTSSGAAVLNSPGHTMLYGGSLSVHVPDDSVQFISLSPPSFSAGCGGINMYFGGFSFISGASFGKLIQAVMQAAPGYVINLAIRTLCPECSDILTELQKLAQAANSMGQNACDIAKTLVNKAAGLVNTWTGQNTIAVSGQSVLSKASKSKAGTGGSSGFFSSFNSYAGDVSSGIKSITKFLNNTSEMFTGGSKTKNQAAESLSKYVGNQTWMALTEAGYGNTYSKEIIMALIGYAVKGKGAKGAGAGIHPMTVPAAANGAKGIMDTVEFGAHPLACATALAGDASNSSGDDSLEAIAMMEKTMHALNYNKSTRVPTCWYKSGNSYHLAPETTPMSTSGALLDCNDPVSAKVSQLVASRPAGGTTAPTASAGDGYNPYLNGDGPTNGCGILGSVAVSLYHAVSNVRNEKPLTTTEEEYIQLAPFPLYQLINDAAVYPSAAGQMIRSYAPLLSYLITRDVLLQWVADAHVAPAGKNAHVNSQVVSEIGAMVKGLYNEIQTDDKRLAVGMTVQEGIMAQINEMNQMIAGQAAMAGMAGNMMFTQSISQTMG